MTEIEPLAPGQQLGRYELLAQVARGGMGQVWVARLKGARGFQKLVAIKTLLPELLDDARIEEMLLEEARIASLIHHSNVVQTTELGEHRGYLYLVMEWVDGESLAFILKRAEERGAMPIAIAVNLLAQACRGLHAAHELTSDLGVHLGVVHRDVSPHNVLVTHEGVVKLVDFGIAKAMNQEFSSTSHGEVKGKFAFMAPEQVLSEDVDRRADVFAIGISLYQITAGVHPFKGKGGRANVLHAITSEDPVVPPSQHVPGYPPALEAVVLKTLEKRPERRYQTTDELRVALEAALPEAFAPNIELEVRDFLTRTMGDRAAARREALRRFQLAADERALAALETGAPALPSQSAGSLRAIVVDEGGPGGVDIRVHEIKHSNAPTVISRPRAGRRVLALCVAGALAGVAGFFGSRVLQSRTHVALGSPTPAEHSAFAAAAPPAAPELAKPTSSGSALRPVTLGAPASSGTPAAPVSTLVAAPQAAARVTSEAAGSARVPRKKKRADSLGLMAPEYAK
ncbi:MAG TPA: serine/threonine-protein kinase [Polyangiaceae bacterium]